MKAGVEVLHSKIGIPSGAPFLLGGGETGALIRAHDWTTTPLGSPETWPSTLKTAVSLMLGSTHPAYIAWGPELTSLYNDGYVPILGAKNPDGLGQPCAQLWAEIWDEFHLIVETTIAGEAQHFVNLPFALPGRTGLPVSYFTFSHTPLRDDSGDIVGFYVAAIETTDTVLAGRRAKVEKKRLAQMFEEAPGFMVTLEGPEHRYISANAAYRTLIGGRDPVGMTVLQVLPELEAQGFLELLDRVYHTREPFRGVSRLVSFDRGDDQPSEDRVLDFVYQPIISPEGQVTGIFVEGSDVTTSHWASEQLRQSEARFRAVFENAGLGVARVPLEGNRWLEVNDALCRMLGYSRVEMLAAELKSLIHPEDRSTVSPSFLSNEAGRRDPFVVEGRFVHKNGGQVWVRQTFSLVRDTAGRPDFQIAVIEDISKQKYVEAELRAAAAEARMLAAEANKVALTDALTDLPNRAAFRQKLEEAVAEGGPMMLILFDADHLKRANDTDGHVAGDVLLRSLADRLRSVALPGAFAARLGGDEFALLIKERIEDQRLDVMLGELCRPLQPKGLTLPHTASAGIAYSSTSRYSASDLMQQADLALYEAKVRGRATWQIFDHDLRAREQSKIGTIALLRQALDKDWIAPHYQPKVNLATGQIVGFEALFRIRRPRGDLHTAGTVGQALREPDLAAQVDRVVLRRVLLDLQGWQARGIALPVAVNLTDSTIRRQGFARDLLDLMNSYSVKAPLLDLEITETVLMDAGDEIAKGNLSMLSQAGLRIALDDFGTGYAALTHLRSYPVDQIKIDQQFVKASLTSPADRAIISAIIGLGQSLSMQVIAEGVENEGQRRNLIAAGCEIGQGFLFSAAVPADEVPDLLARSQSFACSHADCHAAICAGYL